MTQNVRPRDETWLYDLFVSGLDRQVVALALEVDLFEILSKGPSTPDELSRSVALAPRAVEALVTALSALGLVSRRSHVALTTRAEESLVDGCISDARPLFKANVGNLVEVARTGEPLNRKRVAAWLRGEDLSDPAEAAARMHALTGRAARRLAEMLPTSDVSRIIDVAGGIGSLATALTQRHPHLSATVLELPGVCEASRPFLEDAGVSNRVTYVPTNIFVDPFPDAHDAVLFSNVLHDWPEDICLELIEKAKDALPSGGRIWIHEMLLDDAGDGPFTVALMSYMMLLTTRGKQFTGAELRRLLEARGLQCGSPQSAHGYYSVVEAIKP